MDNSILLESNINLIALLDTSNIVLFSDIYFEVRWQPTS